jgi:hypothetical protein
MPKRFTDTDKWKKPFIRSLDGPYKLLWMYIVDDCDHAGIWQVDFEVARIRIGEAVEYETALSIFKEKVFVIEKFKWFIPDFIFFQYGELSEKNRLHVSVLNILNKYQLGPYKPLARGQGQEQGIGQGKGEGTIQGKLEIFEAIFNDEVFLTDLSNVHKGKDVKQAFEECWIHFSQAPRPPEHIWQWKQKLGTWLTNMKKEKTNGEINGNIRHKISLREGFNERNGTKPNSGA